MIIKIDHSKALDILMAEYKAAVQKRLDDFARTRDYDSILSAASYATSTNPKYAVEGQYAVAARDATWGKYYEVLAADKAGSRPMPTLDELLAELPVLAWPNQSHDVTDRRDGGS